jgi:hypothetical protein
MLAMMHLSKSKIRMLAGQGQSVAVAPAGSPRGRALLTIIVTKMLPVCLSRSGNSSIDT